MGLHISFKHPFGKHSVLHQAGGVAKKLAPLAGLIPGVGPIASGLIGGLGSLAHGDNVLDALKSGGMGALGGVAGKALQGGSALEGGDIFSKLARAAIKPGMLGNAAGTGLDLGKTVGLGTGLANIAGARQQSKSAQNYNNANIDLRNQLMSRVLSGGAGQQYNFQPSF